MFNPITLSHHTFGRAGLVPGSFTTAGTTVDPSVFDGAIESVQILTTGAQEFFRVTLGEFFRDGVHIFLAGAEVASGTDDLTVGIGRLVAAPPAPIETKQFDVLVKNSGVVDVSAGRKISFLMVIKTV